jgi:hypothetical protein
MTPKTPAERMVRDIRRATRKHHSAEDKIRIVLEGPRKEDSIAALLQHYGGVAAPERHQEALEESNRRSVQPCPMADFQIEVHDAQTFRGRQCRVDVEGRELPRLRLTFARGRPVGFVARRTRCRSAFQAFDELLTFRRGAVTACANLVESVVPPLQPGFPKWIGPVGPKAAETLAKPRTPSFTRRVRQDPAA